MRSRAANADSRLSFWLRVREFAVPPSMIESATARRRVGDWAGACAAARIDVDLNLRLVARTHGQELAARIRSDLRQLAPDLLRWHMPRIAPDGLLRPGLTISLARYDPVERDGDGVHLVARTAPGWADAGQRISLALWEGSGSGRHPHPHPHPDRCFRLDLHRHLWDVRRTDELAIRSGADRLPANARAAPYPDELAALQGRGCATGRWAAEAAILLHAEGWSSGRVAVRLGGRHRLVLDVSEGGGAPGTATARIATTSRRGNASGLPVLPDAATWVLPDLELLHSGLIELDRLHPLVASALASRVLAPPHPTRADQEPERPPATAAGRLEQAAQPRLVQCRGAQHRIGLVNGVLVALDHDPAEIRREELLAALTGTPLPCLQAIDEAHRRPECLDDVRARLDHGDIDGALATVEGLLGPDALLRGGALRDELETAARRRIAYGLFRAGLAGPGPERIVPERRRTRGQRAHPRHATPR